jgi:nitrate reductase gamma subunit
MPHEELDNPSGLPGVIGRMFLEVFFFRSLFRNTASKVLPEENRVTYTPSYWLWAAGMAFHWSMLIIVLRHFRFFTEPAPRFVEYLQVLDGFFQVGLPVYYVTSVLFLAALVFLLGRRLFDVKLRYLSLPSDYFALYLLLGIGGTGMLMRHLGKVDIIQVKHAIAGWASFQPVVPEGVGVMYFLHVSLVSALFVYFPFSKLLHMPGVFFSPTRNMVNNNRKVHHKNPWNPDLIGHTYAEWEDEFREKLKASDYPLDKE